MVSYPLQLIDGKTGLMWTLLAGKDFFSAAARAQAGSLDFGTQQVRQITRVGVELPTQTDLPSRKPQVAHENFWGSLATNTEQCWSTWPGAHGVLRVNDGVKTRLRSCGFEPSERGVWFKKGEPCLLGAYIDHGRVVPIHRLCEQADGDQRLIILRLLL